MGRTLYNVQGFERLFFRESQNYSYFDWESPVTNSFRVVRFRKPFRDFIKFLVIGNKIHFSFLKGTGIYKGRMYIKVKCY